MNGQTSDRGRKGRKEEDVMSPCRVVPFSSLSSFFCISAIVVVSCFPEMPRWEVVGEDGGEERRGGCQYFPCRSLVSPTLSRFLTLLKD